METYSPEQNSNSAFERLQKIDEKGNLYWSARDLSKLLGYASYRNFLPALKKAAQACRNSGQNEEGHFDPIAGVTTISDSLKRKYADVRLSRYACYLAIQNADPSLTKVALGQAYFALETRKAEVIKMKAYKDMTTSSQKRLFLREQLAQHNLILAALARKAGISKPSDYALFQNHGYMGLYGGLDTKALRELRHLDKRQNLLDHMDTTELAANLSRIRQTEEIMKRDNIQGINTANSTHYATGLQIRQAMQKAGNIMPEDLPVTEEIHPKPLKKTNDYPGRK